MSEEIKALEIDYYIKPYVYKLQEMLKNND